MAEGRTMNTPMTVKTEILKVPGASIYYEVRGSGPVLLMMPGGPADAGAFRRIAGYLEPGYTVVTYDPRGLSHSPLDTPVNDERIVQIFADDAHRLPAATTAEPAFVFGSSGGAVIALELVARHSDQVRTLVPHEPPAPSQIQHASARRWKRSSRPTAPWASDRISRSSWFRPASAVVFIRRRQGL